MRKLIAVITILCYTAVVFSMGVNAVLFTDCNCFECACDGHCYCDEGSACDCDVNVKERECFEYPVVCPCLEYYTPVKLVCAGADSDYDLVEDKPKNPVKSGDKMNN